VEVLAVNNRQGILWPGQKGASSEEELVVGGIAEEVEKPPDIEDVKDELLGS
jgi:hypothetical protein